MVIQASVNKFKSHWEVFAKPDEGLEDVWGTQVTAEAVRDCIARGVFEERPNAMEEQVKEGAAEYNHAARIAYLVVNKDDTPVDLDVGIPSIGYHKFVLCDGNHRLAAAIIRGDKTIPTDFSGEVDYFNHLFVRKSKKYAHV